MTSEKIHIIGLTREELTEKLAAHGFEPFRAKQIWQWVYVKGATDFAQMTSINKAGQAKLAEYFSIKRPGIAKDLTSFDSTRKWLLEFNDKNKIETVFIPEEDRGALCVSSQVGCTLSCSFCHTGTMKLVRNLTAAEIIGQVLIARDGLKEWNKKREDCLFTNIVMMGMGEPLYNYEQVARALKIIMDGEGIAISKRRITLSTSGVVPMIKQCGDELGVNLAISLHAVRDELRDELVPLNKKYPIKELLQACREYPAASNTRRITFEYVMLKDVNDSDADARELVRLLRGIHAKVNLIPWNPWPGAKYETSSRNRQHAFAKIVNDAGFSSPIRATRGQDIFAACGQLKSDSERKKGEKVWLGD
ncbi:MAG: 23S rRNA (adenine(2503)-C(2))-methyltransferase RlmN [Rickettsiales bacterium]|jgi:23S rRNA (adenine2503-C2)-methyltransferase|nr:23S rRNA (adenine(2503)-C(2))-methyltransferase RlmN [Rickettsiales bacterium]